MRARRVVITLGKTQITVEPHSAIICMYVIWFNSTLQRSIFASILMDHMAQNIFVGKTKPNTLVNNYRIIFIIKLDY